MTIFLIIWLSCGGVAIAIAAWKKLNVVKWFFIAPVFGFAAILLVLAEAGAKSAGVWSADGSTFYGGGSSGGSSCGGGGHHGGCGGGSGGGGCGGGAGC